ncbi:uncharacterized protein [Watersipora subatra]|uniref:uncharacterized protein n=1 Tax=Watersipora subatra TaxID=2589382 RepID=UPI00355B7009
MSSQRQGRYYVEYLGWKESRGLFGREFTEPVIKELLERRKNSALPRMTILVNEEEIHISQEAIKKSSSSSDRDKTDYPGIPTKDASFVIQGLHPNTDVVACIFLGYNPYTKCAIHVHVYRFDSEATARLFVDHLGAVIDRPELKNRILSIEKDLYEIGHVELRQQKAASHKPARHSSGSDGYSYGTQSPQSADSMSPSYPTADEALRQRQDIKITKSPRIKPGSNIRRAFTSLHEELEYKMNLEDAQILLPPKDYDTIVRRHGKLDIRDTIIGPNGIFQQMGFKNANGAPEGASNGRVTSEDAAGIQTPKSDGSLQKNMIGQANGYGLARSQSDTFPNRGHNSSLQRQNSQASSDRSNNSDDMFADGIYQGYRPRKHGRSHSRENERLQTEDSGTHMAMWSPTFSFGQTGMKHLPTHHEEEVDALSRTAPASMLTRNELVIPTADYGCYQITRTSGQIKRSQSQKQYGESERRRQQR